MEMYSVISFNTCSYIFVRVGYFCLLGIYDLNILHCPCIIKEQQKIQAVQNVKIKSLCLFDISSL